MFVCTEYSNKQSRNLCNQRCNTFSSVIVQFISIVMDRYLQVILKKMAIEKQPLVYEDILYVATVRKMTDEMWSSNHRQAATRSRDV